MITIIDYGMGNLGSIQNMLKRIKVESEITGDVEKIDKAGKILLPGVGAFDAAMERMEKAGLLPVLNQKATAEKVPVLGICLGMQLLAKTSEEGKRQGLGWIDAHTVKFSLSDNRLKVPHMGWNRVQLKQSSPLTKNLPEEPRFYFVHSYHVQCTHPEDVLTTTHYGIDFHSIIQHDNIFGAQFHPEKSHKYGMKLLENFARI